MRVCKQVGRLAQHSVPVKVAKKVVSRVDSMDVQLVTLLAMKMVLWMVSLLVELMALHLVCRSDMMMGRR